MAVPQVVIVGRPNVGKSSLFNWLARRRLAIVDNFEGVTRDRMVTMLEYEEKYFELVDTGGMGIEDPDNLTADVRHQIDVAIESADLIVFVVDIRSGMMPLDHEVAEHLRSLGRPILLVANKADNENIDNSVTEFYRLGYQSVVCVSTQQNRNRDVLLGLIDQHLPAPSGTTEVETPRMKIAVVGRRNVGKSTFINTLVKTDRMIVSEVPGTTRDSVDVQFDLDGQRFLAIDTPGLRKRKSVRTDLEFYGTHRAQRSIRRADVVLIFFDAAEKISKVDKQLLGYVVENHKPVIFVVNKWDLLHSTVTTDRWAQYLRDEFPTLAYAPIAFVTGQTGKNVQTLLNHATMLFKQSSARVSTGQLNRLVHAAVDKHAPPMHHGQRPKIFYATQVSTQPPTIVVMCSQPKAFGKDYRRYLLGILRDHLSFSEVPIKLYLQHHHHNDTLAKRLSNEVTVPQR